MSEQKHDLAAPVNAGAVLTWLRHASQRLHRDDISAEELINLLGEFRQLSTLCADASDWLLLAAREQGASLRQIAPVFGKGYVRAPAARLEKLHRQALDPDQWLDILERKHA